MVDITNAHNETNEIYKYLKDMETEFVSKYTKELDSIVNKLKKGIDVYSNAELRDFMMRLSIEAYTLGTVKEQSELKLECAEALQKEAQARIFATSAGAVEARKNQSIIDTTDKQAITMLYSAVTGVLKTKADEAHRIVAVLNGVLISRAADAKNTFSPRNEVDQMALEPQEENIE